MNLGGVDIAFLRGALSWCAGLAVDADGAPNAYVPSESGLPALDALANAGHPGNWWGLATDTGSPTGQPVVQGAGDPFPGYYVSVTALYDRTYPEANPRRYVDASKVPYLVVPPELRAAGVKLGDVARVSYRDNWCEAIVADVGPRGHVGEGSIALARALSIDPSPRHGGVGRGCEVVLFVGSSRGWPRTMDDVRAQVVQLYDAWNLAVA